MCVHIAYRIAYCLAICVHVRISCIPGMSGVCYCRDFQEYSTCIDSKLKLFCYYKINDQFIILCKL